MSATIYTTPKLKIETNGKYEMKTMHLMDTQADEEKALCGANVPADDLTGVDDYMERRKDGLPVGTICELCKPRTVAFAMRLHLELVAEGRMDEAQEYRRLADRLTRETSLNR